MRPLILRNFYTEIDLNQNRYTIGMVTFLKWYLVPNSHNMDAGEIIYSQPCASCGVDEINDAVAARNDLKSGLAKMDN